jgi:pimeloyl-ACP methyl ester carboxylesterase
MKTLYALIVAIDKYPIPAHQLNGCVNDATAFSTYLKNFCEANTLTFNEIRLFDEAAKRLAIVDGFKHFDAANDDDMCIYYYSGHGSQMKAPSQFWDETDGLSETIVCWDSRTKEPGNRDLADKEISYLIHKATTGKNTHFLAVTDCCHSGSNTRDLNIKARMAETCQTSVRAGDEFVGLAEYINFQPPAARYVHLAAAKDDETAKEYPINSQQRGVFTYSLIETLEQAGGNISYAELISRVNLKCRNRVKEQTPLLNTYVDNEAGKLSFLGQTQLRGGTFIVHNDNTEGWIVNIGGAQGIPVSGATFTLENGVTTATTKVGPNSSKLSGLELLVKDQQYKATLTGMNLSKMRLALSSDSDTEGVDAIKKAFKTGVEGLQLVDNECDTDYVIRAWDGALRLTKVDSSTPLFRRVKGYDTGAVTTFLGRVDAVANWRNRLEIANPNTSIGDDAVEITFYDGTGTPVSERIFNQPNEAMESNMQVSITNKWSKPLWVSAVYFGADFMITNKFLAQKFIQPNEKVWVEFENGKNIPLAVQPEYLSWGINELEEYFKIFVSTDEINTFIHNQEGLPLDEHTRTTTRAIGRALSAPMHDWRTFERNFHYICPITAVAIDTTKQVASLGNITLTAPAGFSAKASLSTTNEAKRALSSMKILRGGTDMSSAALASSMGSSPTMDVLELEDMKGNISHDNPLIVNLSDVQDDEIVLALGYDAKLDMYFPLGISNTEGVVNIHTLPTEQATTRSLGRSVKMFFKKLIKPLTGKFEYPMLRFVKYDETGLTDATEYVDDKALLMSKVAEAQNIGLFIHGWIGSTADQVGSVRRPQKTESRTLDMNFDLVLAFDYESLGTKIEDSATDLEKKLAEIGLKKDCGKHFTIIAHSMGGLVSRYFIERLSGKEFVSHLIMLGTSNGGSEIADLRGTIAKWLTMGVNGVSFLQPYLLPISWIGKLMTQATTTLEEHSASSVFMQTLNSSPDTGVPYHIVAGNTQLLQAKRPEEYGLIQKFKDMWKEKDGLLASDMFFGKPNDLVVSVESITHPGQQKNVQILPVASTHFAYFDTESEGLEALAMATRAI